MTTERTADLSSRIGEPLGETPWMRISQQNINRFGELTGDTQWIHTDPYRAAHTPEDVQTAADHAAGGAS